MTDIVIVAATRTAIGKFGGALAKIPAPELGATVIRELLARAKLKPDQISEVILGQVLAAGSGQNPARQALIKAGLPAAIPAMTINKVCGSGLKAVMLAASQIAAGEARLAVAGGMESMSNAPYLARGLRAGLPLGEHKLEDANLVDGLMDAYGHGHMGLGGELVAEECGLGRADQDRFALASYEKALRAQREGAFDAELVPVEVPGRKGTVTLVNKDESPRETSLEALAKLQPAFKTGGTVTAGNASKLNDGGAAVIVASAERARDLGAKPLARIVAQSQFAHEPERFLAAPKGAIERCLEKAGWKIADVDLFEVNEAFSGIECVRRELDISEARFNVNGGAVALGHPIGASGARLLVTLLYALRARSKKRGVASLCLGGGEAVALAVELA